jgi:hypothetical protein
MKNKLSKSILNTLYCIGILTDICTTLVAQAGATTPFTIYEAENATLENGATLLTQIGIPSAPIVEFESSGRKNVSLDATNDSLSWIVSATTNAIVERVCIPNAPTGGGIDVSYFN